MSKPDLSDYVDVATRIAAFRERYPNGSLRPLNPDKPFEVVTIGEQTFIAYSAIAVRGPDDTAPGVGCAWEPFPGKTPYTKDSELMVCETSAWGRAIVAALAADTRKGVASAEEVHARHDAPLTASELRGRINHELTANRQQPWTQTEIEADFTEKTGQDIRTADIEALRSYLDSL